MTKFVVKEGKPIAGQLVYDGTGFETEPRPSGCIASVSIHELELMLDEDDKRVVYVTGYCPYQSWRPAVLTSPKYHSGVLYALLDKPIVAGTTVGLHPRGESWPILVDRRSGWIRLGKGDPREDREGVEFAPNAVAVLADQHLVALWLRPERLPAGVFTLDDDAAVAGPNGGGG